nr:hypothetical protein GCM10020093_073040 [Planobispora longispora]
MRARSARSFGRSRGTHAAQVAGALPSAVLRRVPAAVPSGEAISARSDRMARFAAGARRIVRRALMVGGMVAAGWVLSVVFGFLGAAPATAETTAVTGAAGSGPLDGAASESALQVDDFPTEDGDLSAAGNAEAMAGRGVDGLTSQSSPVLPAPPPSTTALAPTDSCPSPAVDPAPPGRVWETSHVSYTTRR